MLKALIYLIVLTGIFFIGKRMESSTYISARDMLRKWYIYDSENKQEYQAREKEILKDASLISKVVLTCCAFGLITGFMLGIAYATF